MKNLLHFLLQALFVIGAAGQQPPANPEDIRAKPSDGLLFGGGIPFDPATQLAAKNATAIPDGKNIRIDFPAAAASDQSVQFKPAAGRWDLRDYFQIRVKVRNLGRTPISPRIQAQSNGGPGISESSTAQLPPGGEDEIVVSFAPSTPVILAENGPDYKFTSDAVSGVTISADPDPSPRSIEVEAIIADVPPPADLPDWLGKKPPVDGDWTQTFSEDFDGTALDVTKWRFAAENFWDKKSHFSKDNVIVKDGVATLRFEKKRGPQNDDPDAKPITDYATGFLDTYGKWAQRYGYFEARMKLPKAPGLWPAFWLMPDRGGAGAQWTRQDTQNGGMEFDLMEFQPRWGIYRYNIAMHWDGYGKDHKTIGSEMNYVQPDKDGFITAGLLWLPGQAVYYANGKEILRWENPRISNVQSDLMFTHVAGDWGNDGNAFDDRQLPADFVIDYVRVWQRKDLATPAPVDAKDDVMKPAAE